MRYFFIGVIAAIAMAELMKPPVARACRDGSMFWCGFGLALGADVRREDLRK